LRGHGFTEESKVYAGYNPDAFDYSTDQLFFETEYVSPTELRVHVDLAAFAPQSDTVDLPEGENLRIWVKGSEEKFELSQARDVTLRPTGTGKAVTFFQISESDLLRSRPKTAVVTSVWPFPIRLMSEHSAEELKVTIHGENFVPEDRVRFSFGGQTTNDREVRTEYVSATTLHAWLPRQLWRKHRLSYRLVVVTAGGQRYVRQVDQKD
jgi:hypothetical protein